MTQHYIGCKQVEAWEEERNGEPGYAVKYPDGYISWSPQDVFESAYLPMGCKPGSDGSPVGNDDTVTAAMVNAFIKSDVVTTLGEKTTVVIATLANGFELVESSSCVDPANYNEDVGAGICRERIRSRVWLLLGFALQWGRSGLTAP
jgi:hypothetical protein